MSSHEMTWQRIARLDPFLAGAVACRGHEWWDEVSAEQEADSVGLAGEQRATFLQGWQFELEEREQERKRERAKERDDMLEEASGKGDPAAR
jgi:hypothetical protein